jgi:hypothetical protein
VSSVQVCLTFLNLGSINIEGIRSDCYNQLRSTRFPVGLQSFLPPDGPTERPTGRTQGLWKRGQVAQVVERSPEKAGVGGSTPSLATILFKTLAIPIGSP